MKTDHVIHFWNPYSENLQSTSVFYLSQSLNNIILKIKIQQVFISVMPISEWLCAMTLALEKKTQ